METNGAAQIHNASLELLADPGVKLEHEGIVKLFLDHGARPGRQPATVSIPPEMVTEYLGLCSSEVVLADRQGNQAVLQAGGKPAIWSCPGLNIWEKGDIRPFTSGDMARCSRLLDGLGNVQGVFGMAMDDIKPGARDVAGLNIMAQNTSKHIRAFCFTPAGGKAMAEMKKVVGDHPWFSIGFTAHGPLRWTNLALSIFEATAGHGIPVTINGEPMAGTSGPVTLAGSAAVGNAEILAGIIAIQLMEPGRPCIYNLGLAHIFDMRTMIAVTGAPENALLAKISADMGQFYNLPSASWVSTEAMCPDSQAALEKMLGFHTHMAAGISNIWGVGQLESELTFAPAQAVIDNEMISFARRFHRGVDVTPETLAVDVTRAVGIGGSFLDQMHTAENFKSEFYMPELLCRVKRADWEAGGRKQLFEVAEEKAGQLMAEEPENGLTREQKTGLQELADRFLKGVS